MELGHVDTKKLELVLYTDTYITHTYANTRMHTTYSRFLVLDGLSRES